jgi:branched-chain amino acid transport system ATP-binding protein
MSEPLLSVRGLHAGYRDLEALRDVEEGAVVALLGANGVGKTTLNKTLSALLKPTRGQIFFEGRRIDGFAPPEIVAAGLIHVPEGRKLYPNMSFKENLELGAYRRARIARAISIMCWRSSRACRRGSASAPARCCLAASSRWRRSAAA